eukprot:g19835.t1
MSRCSLTILQMEAGGAFYELAGDQLYFAEGNNPRRIHLVRFHCTGCEEACQTYITVNPDYVASLQQDLDFTCAMLAEDQDVEKRNKEQLFRRNKTCSL